MRLLTENRKLLLAAAGVILAAGAASAETMKAEIPFAFRVGRRVMQPGAYRVSLAPSPTGKRLLKLTNIDVKQTVLLSPVVTDAPKAWSDSGLPRLRFACDGGPCTMLGLWMGEGNALTFLPEHERHGEPRITDVALRPERAVE
jgi:hypothetical protein